jgi:hypothetical protein
MSDCICGEINARHCSVHNEPFTVYWTPEDMLFGTANDALMSGDGAVTSVVSTTDYNKLEKQNQILIEALKFYAGTDCYAVVSADGSVDGFSEDEPGNTAREALKQIGVE